MALVAYKIANYSLEGSNRVAINPTEVAAIQNNGDTTIIHLSVTHGTGHLEFHIDQRFDQVLSDLNEALNR